jgi:hypothetical protein
MCTDHIIKDSKIVENGTATDIEHHAEANGSFAHAVLNMIGMLIGEVLSSVLQLY